MRISGFRYGTFGMRREWISSFLSRGREFFENNSLGPRQIEAFIWYLRDTELIDGKLNLTELFCILKKIFEIEGINSKVLWGIIWVNLCFNAPLFNWWANVPVGKYSRENIINLLANSYGKMNKTILNGYSSIVETLGKSPIGELLGQGLVERKGKRVISVVKNGGKDISSIVVLYNLYRFSEKRGVYKINLEEIENDELSPQKIFTISSFEVEDILKNSIYDSFFRVGFEERKVSIFLDKGINSISLLKTYVGGL